MSKDPETREAWLRAGVDLLDKEFFSGNGYELPKSVRVSCAFPKACGTKAIGQCCDPAGSADATSEIFISPMLDGPVEIVATLLHELIHASVGVAEGHKGMFRKLAKEFGFAGKMTATYAEEGSDLHRTLEVIAGRIGKYPHAVMILKKKPTKPNPWVRYRSINQDDYRVVANSLKIEEHGAPRDPWGDEMEPVS